MIMRVGNRNTQTWTHALLGLIPPALDRQPVSVELERPDGQRRETILALDQLGTEFEEETHARTGRQSPWRPDLPALIGEVGEDTPAARAGLETGDRITAINDHAVEGWRDIASLIPEHGIDADGQPREMTLELERAGRTLQARVVPDISGGRPVIGVQAGEPDAEIQALMERAFTILRHDPASAVGEAVGETWRLTTATLGILGRMITGKASLSNIWPARSPSPRWPTHRPCWASPGSCFFSA
jgi:regulator of sigma E protease